MTWYLEEAPQPGHFDDSRGDEGGRFRDPLVWKEGQEWRMAVGSGIHGKGGAVLLYGSRNLIEWQYIGILYQKDLQDLEGMETGTMWECPSIFHLGEKWVLIISVCNAKGPIGTFYYIGDYHEDHFIPDGPARRLDHGAEACFYAPQTFLSGSGERVMFGWLREARSVYEMKRAGWSGAMSLPRLLSLSEAGELWCAPLARITGLRRQAETLETPGQLTSKVLAQSWRSWYVCNKMLTNGAAYN